MPNEPNSLWVVSALLVKTDGSTTSTSMFTGYETAATEDEARGALVAKVFENKPGFAVYDTICIMVPTEVLQSVLENVSPT